LSEIEEDKSEELDKGLVKRLTAKAEVARKKRIQNQSKGVAKKIIADIKRIAEDKDNRYPGTCSRDRYRKYGHYSQEEVYDLFGNHAELQREAGLRDMRTTTAYRNRRAKLKTEERIQKYIQKEVQPYAGKFWTKRKKGGVKHLVVGSDFHSQDCDPFALEVFLDVIRRTQPEYIALNGDVYDFPAVSKWLKPPNKLLNLQAELDWTYENILSPVRRAAPKADISFVIGNHEYRLIRFLAETPGLASLRCLSFSELFRLDELKISLVHNDAMLAPNEGEKKREYMDNWRIYEDCFVVTHGTSTGRNAAFQELERWSMSGTSGHVHRPQLVTGPSLTNPHACWMITGMMAKAPEHGREFIHGPNRWVTGFGVVTLDNGIAFQRQVLIKDGKAEFGGVFYRSR